MTDSKNKLISYGINDLTSCSKTSYYNVSCNTIGVSFLNAQLLLHF